MAKKHWIAGAIRHPGAFSAKAKHAGMSTSSYAKAKAGAAGTLGRQARLAETLMNINQHTASKRVRKRKRK